MKKIEDILKKLYKDLKLKTIFKYLVFTLIIGYVLNVFWSHKNFYVNNYVDDSNIRIKKNRFGK